MDRYDSSRSGLCSRPGDHLRRSPARTGRGHTPAAGDDATAGPERDVRTLQLTDKQWGTSVVVNCRYGGAHAPGYSYQLVAFDAAGKPQQLGWWMSVSGSASTVTTASSIRLTDISRLEVRSPTGEPLLTAVPGRA